VEYWPPALLSSPPLTVAAEAAELTAPPQAVRPSPAGPTVLIHLRSKADRGLQFLLILSLILISSVFSRLGAAARRQCRAAFRGRIRINARTPCHEFTGLEQVAFPP
jgi:hypothetical protein